MRTAGYVLAVAGLVAIVTAGQVAFWWWATHPVVDAPNAPGAASADLTPVPLTPDTRRPLLAPSLLRPVRPLRPAYTPETTDLPISTNVRNKLRRIR